MPEFIFKKNNYGNIIDHFENKGYNREDQNDALFVEYEGHFWSQEATYFKSINGLDRLVLFLKTLLKKISVTLGLEKQKNKELINLSRDWTLACDGSIHLCLYINTLSKINKQLFIFIGLDPKSPNRFSSIKAIPSHLSFTIEIPQILEGAADTFEEKLRELEIPFEKNRLPNRSHFIISNKNMTLLLKAVGVRDSSALEKSIIAPIVKFEEKLEELEIPFEKNRLPNHSHFMISNKNMAPLLKAGEGFESSPQEAKVVNRLFERLGARNYAHHSADISGRPRIENTIALSIASLDLDDYKILTAPGVTMTSTPEKSIIAPSVEIDELGMTIKLPEGKEVLAKRCFELFYKVSFVRNEVTINGVKYEYEGFVPRNDIAESLKILGLENIHKDMHPDYADGQYKYIRYMKNVGLLHDYTPTQHDNPLKSIKKSLKNIIRNCVLIAKDDGTFDEVQHRPYVVAHPKGYLFIRLPEDRSDASYANRLKKYLQLDEYRKINFIRSTKKRYTKEFVIQEENIPQLLKLMLLQQDSEGNSLVQKLERYKQKTKYQPQYKESDSQSFSFGNKKQLDVEASIRHSIMNVLKAAANPMKGELSEEGLLSDLKFSIDGLKIVFPKRQNEQTIHTAEGYIFSPAKLIAHLFRLHTESDTVFIPKKRLKSFIQKDLSLSSIPKDFSTIHETFYRHLISERGIKMGLRNNPYGFIKGMNLRNPTIVIPENMVVMSNEEIVNEASRLLEGYKNKEAFCQLIRETLHRSGKLLVEARTLLHQHMTLIVRPDPSLGEVTKDRHLNAVLSVGKSTGCILGRAAKIADIFRTMIYPESSDKMKTLILHEVEEFKNELLSQILYEMPGPEWHVHRVNSVKAFWGHRLGLDVAEGLRDELWHRAQARVGKAQLDEFVDVCNIRLVDHLFEKFSEARVEYSQSEELILKKDDEALELENENLFRERLVSILKDEGMTTDEIGDGVDEGILSQLLPINEKGVLRLSREAFIKILVDIGLIYD